MNYKIVLWLSLAAVLCQSCRTKKLIDSTAKPQFDDQQRPLQFASVNIGNETICYVKVGDEHLPTLFFVHGSPGSWLGYKNYLLDQQLQKHFRMIAIDRPGFGCSHAGHAYRLSEQSELIHHIVKHELNGKNFHLIGHSLGGPIIVKMAQDYPQYYASLTILAGAISPYHEPKEIWRHLFMSTALQYLLPVKLRTSNREIYYFKKALYQLDQKYERLTMPVTFIHGSKDPLVTVNNVHYGLDKLKNNRNVQAIIIEGANHFIPWEHFNTVKTHLLSVAE
jgi:pimeloyl-ACP methyl ester carboxylesterase